MTQILIVDDDRDVRSALGKRLGHVGHDVFLAANGQDAINQFGAHRPQVVLLDASMPDMSGFEVCRTIQAVDPNRDTRIFFLSGATTPNAEYVSRCVEACDADGFIRKPFDFNRLLSLVEGADAPTNAVEVV